ncbi:glucose 1-dehydrogenase [Myxococcaceae bacterium GXIMD 01537]
MKAVAIFYPAREVRVVDTPKPRLRSPMDVLVRTREVGLCGTDQEILQGHHGGPPAGEDFLILGHEALGEVVEAGSAVRGYQAGDWVVPRVRRPCPHASCPACRADVPDFCVTGDYTERGIQGAHGFGAEFFVEDASYLHRVPDALSGVGVLTEPLTIAQKALRQVRVIQGRLPWTPDAPGRAVVLGAGPVGQLGLMALLSEGYEATVYSRSRKPNEKAAAAEALGVPYLSSQDVDAAELARRAGPIDLVYEAAGTARAALGLLEALGPNGVFVFTGVPGRPEPHSLEAAEVMRRLVLKNQVVLGTVNAEAGDFRAAIEGLAHYQARWPGSLARLITQRHPPESYAEVARARGGIKHVITFG